MKKAILKGTEWIGRLLGITAGEPREESPAGSPPRGEDRPALPAPILPPAQNDFRPSNPSPVDPPEPEPEMRRMEGEASFELKMRILRCCSLRTRVEEEMVQLCRDYWNAMPPSRLLLWAWRYPKGSHPKTVHWVRLCRKQRTFDQASLAPTQVKRPRWFRILKVRSREDLEAHIHWNGVRRHRKTVMSFYDRWWALNRSHSILAKGMHAARLAFKHHSKSSARELAQLEPVRFDRYHHLDRAGNRLVETAMTLGRLVDKNLLDFEELEQWTTPLPFYSIVYRGETEFDRKILWQHVPSGVLHKTLSERWLKKQNLSPREVADVMAGVLYSRDLLRTLSRRLKVIRDTENRLTKALVDSKEIIRRCTDLPRMF